jgi:hypothetical protein
MLLTNHYRIRPANATDEPALRRLAGLDSQAPLRGRILIGELDGTPAVALSMTDGRVIADPFRRTAQLTAAMRLQAGVTVRVEASPSLRDRIIAGLAPSRRPMRSAA